MIVPPLCVQVVRRKSGIRRHLLLKDVKDPGWPDWCPLIVVGKLLKVLFLIHATSTPKKYSYKLRITLWNYKDELIRCLYLLTNKGIKNLGATNAPKSSRNSEKS